jgi:hypothetical protein
MELRTNARQYCTARYVKTSSIYRRTQELRSRHPPTPLQVFMLQCDKMAEEGVFVRRPTVMELLLSRQSAHPIFTLGFRRQVTYFKDGDTGIAYQLRRRPRNR